MKCIFVSCLFVVWNPCCVQVRKMWTTACCLLNLLLPLSCLWICECFCLLDWEETYWAYFMEVSSHLGWNSTNPLCGHVHKNPKRNTISSVWPENQSYSENHFLFECKMKHMCLRTYLIFFCKLTDCMILYDFFSFIQYMTGTHIYIFDPHQNIKIHP